MGLEASAKLDDNPDVFVKLNHENDEASVESGDNSDTVAKLKRENDEAPAELAIDTDTITKLKSEDNKETGGGKAVGDGPVRCFENCQKDKYRHSLACHI